MCANQLWFKVNVNLFNDSKIKFIRKQKKGHLIVCCFFQFMCMAGIVNDGGLIYINRNIPYTMEMLAVEFGCSVSDAEYAVKILKDFEMIEITEEGYILVSNWAKYQNIEALENLRNRVAKSRAKKKAENETSADATEEKAVNKTENSTKKKGGRKKKEIITDDNKIEDNAHIIKENIIEQKINTENYNNNKETVNNYEVDVDNFPDANSKNDSMVQNENMSNEAILDSVINNQINSHINTKSISESRADDESENINKIPDSQADITNDLNTNVTCNKENVTVTNCNTDVTSKIKNKKKTKNEIKKKSESKKVNSITVVDEEDNADNLLVHFSDEIEHRPGDVVVKSFSFNNADNNSSAVENVAIVDNDAVINNNQVKNTDNKGSTIAASVSSDISLNISADKLMDKEEGTDGNIESVRKSKDNNSSLPIHYDTCTDGKSDAAYNLLKYYESLTGYLGGIDYGQMKLFVIDHGEKHVKAAIESAIRRGKKNKDYINGILMNWRKEGYPEDEVRVRKDGGKPKCNKESNEADTGFKAPKRRKLTEAEKRRLEEKYAND